MLAARIFRWAGIYGLVMIAPMYLTENYVGQSQPPPITHPEFYYGFLGVTLAWQVAFLIIASDPVRYRPLMAAAMIEKFSYAAAVFVLLSLGRVAGVTGVFAGIDLVLGVLFVVAWRATRAAEIGAA